MPRTNWYCWYRWLSFSFHCHREAIFDNNNRKNQQSSIAGIVNIFFGLRDQVSPWPILELLSKLLRRLVSLQLKVIKPPVSSSSGVVYLRLIFSNSSLVRQLPHFIVRFGLLPLHREATFLSSLPFSSNSLLPCLSAFEWLSFISWLEIRASTGPKKHISAQGSQTTMKLSNQKKRGKKRWTYSVSHPFPLERKDGEQITPI